MFFVKTQLWGHSHVIALPKLLRQMTGIKKGDWLFAEVKDNGEIIIRKTITTKRGIITRRRNEMEKKYEDQGDKEDRC